VRDAPPEGSRACARKIQLHGDLGDTTPYEMLVLDPSRGRSGEVCSRT
jgi:hypothetical protein